MGLDSTFVVVEVLAKSSVDLAARCEVVVVDVLAPDLSHVITVAVGADGRACAPIG